MKILLEVEVEMKDEHGAADNNPPDPSLVAAYVTAYGREATRGEYGINWMIRSTRVVEG